MIPPSFWNNLVTPTFFWITCNRMEEKKTLSLDSSGQLDAMRVVRRARLLVDTAVERIFSCIFLLKFDEKPLEETRRMKCWRRGVLVQFQAQPKWRRPLRLIDQAQPIRYDVVYSFFFPSPANWISSYLDVATRRAAGIIRQVATGS